MWFYLHDHHHFIQILLTNVVLKQQIRRYKILHNKYQHRREDIFTGESGIIGVFFYGCCRYKHEDNLPKMVTKYFNYMYIFISNLISSIVIVTFNAKQFFHPINE